jgi:hypothetical protein
MKSTLICLILTAFSIPALAQDWFLNPPKGDIVYVVDGVWAGGDTMGWQKPPQFPRGRNEMYIYLNDRIPLTQPMEDEIFRQGGIGRVMIRFELDAAGRMSDAIIYSSNVGTVEDRVLQAVLDMPDWEPGVIDDSEVACTVFLPISFINLSGILVMDESTYKVNVGRSKVKPWVKALTIAGGVAIIGIAVWITNLQD